MAQQFYDDIDLNQNELRETVVEKLSSAPASPVEGQIYYDTMDKAFKQYNGTAWINLMDKYTKAEIDNKLSTTDSSLSAHMSDTTDAHDASAISIVDTNAHFTSAHVEGALDEEAIARKAVATDLSDYKTSNNTRVGDIETEISTARGVDLTLDARLDGIDTTVAGKANTSHTHVISEITDAGTAASKDTGIAAGNVPVLDASGKLNTAVLPALAITDTFVVASELEMTGLTAQRGDIAVRTDLNKTFILKTDDPSLAANWEEMLTPTDAVSSVNGKTGAVTLNHTDVGAEAAFTKGTAFNKNFGTAAGTVSEGNHIHSTATSTTNGFMASTDKSKLDGVEANANNYSLPIASSTVLGGIKSGTDISIDANGNVSVIDDSHNHIIGNVDGLQVALDSKQKQITQSATAPTSPVDGDLWLDESVSPNVLKKWDGTLTTPKWVKVTPTVPSDVGAEPSFAKNTGFNLNLGTTAGTVSEGNHIHGNATATVSGFMASTDKSKLDGIASGAEVNQNAFSNIVIGTTTIAADTKMDTLSFVAGSNISLTPDATNDKVSIAVTGVAQSAHTHAISDVTNLQTTLDGKEPVFTKNTAFNKSFGTGAGTVAEGNHIHANATATVSGFMSSTDKSKLDGVEAGATGDMTAAEIKTSYESNIDTNAYTDAEKTKLSGVEANANNYSLPVANSTTLGGVLSGTDITVDISGNVSIVDDSHNHVIANVDGLQTALDSKVDDTEVATTATAGKLLKLDANGNLPTNVTGSASKLTTARTIALGGDVTGSTTFDGSANVTITATVADDSHNHVISNVDGLQIALDSKVNLAGATMTGALTLHADPTQALHAATKNYVDSVAQGLDVKESVRAALDSNIVLVPTTKRTALSVDGVGMNPGDRVLVFGQTAGAENGIYVVETDFDLVRATDADTDAEVTSGMFTFVSEGTNYADAGFVLSTDGTITLGTTALSFTQFSGAGQVTAGFGLTKSGNTLSVNDSEIATQTELNSHIGSGGTAHANASTTVAGFMSATDKSKLDGVQAGAEVNTVDSVNGKTGAVSLTSGDVGAEPAFTKNTAFNKSFGTAAGTVAEGNHTHSELHTHANKATLDKVTQSGTETSFDLSKLEVKGHTHANATATVHGFMASGDKSKLDGIEAGAQANDVTSVNGKIGAVSLGSADVGAEPAFTKNTGFNKNLGTAAGTVAEGNHTHTAADVGAEPAFTKNTAFNKNFGTAVGTVAEGNHGHTAAEVGAAEAAHLGTIGNLNTVDKSSAVGGINEVFNPYTVSKTGKDTSGIFTSITYKRISDATIYQTSDLSNKDVNGNYQTLTKKYYTSADQVNAVRTETWTLTYDADGDITDTSVVIS